MSSPHGHLLTLAAGRQPHSETVVTRSVVDSAIEHRLHGLLWQWIDEGLVNADGDARDMLAPVVLASRHWSRGLRRTAAELCSFLGDHGVEVALFKGIAAEERWYPAPGTRPAVDIDLWLAPHQLHLVGDVVGLLQPEHPLVDDVTDLVVAGRLRSVDLVWGGVGVDLHFDPFKFGVWYEDLDSVWAGVEDIGEGVRAIGGGAELLNALLHLNKDRFSRLLGFVDVVRGSMTRGVAEEAWELATRIGAMVPVACSARVVRETLGVEVEIPDPPPGWKTSLWEMLWPESSRLQGVDGYSRMRRRQDWLPLLCRGRQAQAFKHLSHVSFPPKILLEYFNPQAEGLPYPVALWKARIGSR